MQAPDAPAMEKDAAQRAAESDTITMSDVKADKIELKVSPTPAPWLQAIMSNTTGNFRDGVLASLKGEQAKGSLNCAPVLTDTAQSAFAGIEKIACTAKDGGQIDGEFADSGDGDLKAEYPDGTVVKVTKNDGDFNVETRISK